MEAALRIEGFAETYERVVVPAIFAHWADELIERARPIGASDRVLDLGCGTGIVARKLRARLGGGLRITGIDANPGMIAVARSVAPEIDFREARAESLPFEDGNFELVLCQQMLQFAADKAAVLREARRVLVPGGRLLLATWRPRSEQPLFEVLGRIAERHLGASDDKRFALGDEAALLALLAEVGFDARLEVVQRTDRFAEFPYRSSVCAANFDLAPFAPEELEAKMSAIEAESIEAARRFADGGQVAAPSRANVVTAVAKGGRP